jgi:peptidoglycan-associated lipoprotein
MAKKFLISTFLTVSMLLTGCGSTSKNATDMADALQNEANMVIELNGDSDSNKAGALKTIHFAFNSSELSTETQAILADNAKFLMENPAVAIQVEGHCDERGGIQFNLALGERRADSIIKYLGALGVDEKRMTAISYGKERPLAFGHDESAWSQNRRGNFVITAK